MMMNKAKIALWVSVLVSILPLPITSALVAPQMGMGILMLYFFFVMPALFVFLGAYLAPEWKKLWWLPLIAAVMFVLVGFFWANTWQFAGYVPIYFVIGYGVMAVCAVLNIRNKKHEQEKMDIQDL